jgi:hypothetical protein
MAKKPYDILRWSDVEKIKVSITVGDEIANLLSEQPIN